MKEIELRPAWSIDASEMTESERRHGWMVRQLLLRRGEQNLPGDTLHSWYTGILRRLFLLQDDWGRGNCVSLYEVLADGLGTTEPNWSALHCDSTLVDGAVLSSDRIAQLKSDIRKKRNSIADVDVRTHRAIGSRLYQSCLFAVTQDGAYRLTGPSDGQFSWVQCGSVPSTGSSLLPVKCDSEARVDEYIATEEAHIARSLRTISDKVLWPAFFNNSSNMSFSLVYLHTSLWEEVAGVWALHCKCSDEGGGAPRIASNDVCGDIQALRHLIEPAIFCLSDVSGWALHREGEHAKRRRSVNIYCALLGIAPPVWGPDGLDLFGTFGDEVGEIYNGELGSSLSETIGILYDLQQAARFGDELADVDVSEGAIRINRVIKLLCIIWVTKDLGGFGQGLVDDPSAVLSIEEMYVRQVQTAARDAGIELNEAPRTTICAGIESVIGKTEMSDLEGDWVTCGFRALGSWGDHDKTWMAEA